MLATAGLVILLPTCAITQELPIPQSDAVADLEQRMRALEMELARTKAERCEFEQLLQSSSIQAIYNAGMSGWNFVLQAQLYF